MRTIVAVTWISIWGSGLVMGEDQKNNACDPQQFEGTYDIVSGEMDGKAVPREQLHHVKAVIQKERIVTYDRDQKEVYSASFELQPDKKGCHISMTSTQPAGGGGVNAFGLIRKDGETVKLIYALPDGEQPKEFKTQPKQHLFVLKKVSSSTDATSEKLKTP